MAKLTFTISTMGAGKTRDLLRAAFNYEENNLKPLVAKPLVDTKGNRSVISRNGESRECDFLIDKEMQIYEYILENHKDFDALIIDEAQFLTKEQVVQLSDVAVFLNKPVMCYGLRTDFNNNLFEGSAALFAYAHEFDAPRLLTAINKEGKRCTHNLRLRNGKPYFGGQQIEIGENESYRPVTLREWKESYNEYKRNLEK